MTPALSRSLAALVLFLAVLPATALAQQAARATLTGTVTDPAGAVVAGVRVTATLESAGIRRETSTNDRGVYVLTELVPGEYKLRVEGNGFRSTETKVPISLNVGQSVTLNISLEVGLDKTTVLANIPAAAVAVDNSASVVEGVIDSRDVEGLPLNGRNFLELALLIPGNAPAPNFDPTKTNAVVISTAPTITTTSLAAPCKTSRRKRFASFRSRLIASPRRWAVRDRRSSTW